MYDPDTRRYNSTWWIAKKPTAQKVRKKKFAGNKFDSTLHNEFALEKRALNGQFYKEAMIKDWLHKLMSLGPSFRKVGHGIICTTCTSAFFMHCL
jgi:hypothetical protein